MIFGAVGKIKVDEFCICINTQKKHSIQNSGLRNTVLPYENTYNVNKPLVTQTINEKCRERKLSKET